VHDPAIGGEIEMKRLLTAAVSAFALTVFAAIAPVWAGQWRPPAVPAAPTWWILNHANNRCEAMESWTMELGTPAIATPQELHSYLTALGIPVSAIAPFPNLSGALIFGARLAGSAPTYFIFFVSTVDCETVRAHGG
jgi:hypothetical protein